ncbi:MAG: hypothetical protein GC180_00230 [Bacteroidetes bacterium]|nr:hypothetical protein [Bacteroidota bacterium]
MKWTKFLQAALFVAAFILFTESNAQMEIQKGIEGKTFFDTARSMVHEAYEYKLLYRMIINPKTGHAEPVGDPAEVKNGLYIRYRKDGTIECTGYYRNDVACGEWSYKDETGKIELRSENLGGDCYTGN